MDDDGKKQTETTKSFSLFLKLEPDLWSLTTSLKKTEEDDDGFILYGWYLMPNKQNETSSYFSLSVLEPKPGQWINHQKKQTKMMMVLYFIDGGWWQTNRQRRPHPAPPAATNICLMLMLPFTIYSEVVPQFYFVVSQFYNLFCWGILILQIILRYPNFIIFLMYPNFTLYSEVPQFNNSFRGTIYSEVSQFYNVVFAT